MKRAHPLLPNMLSIGSFIIIFSGLLGSVWWACSQDKNET